MANTLGTLLLELQANTTAFAKGMGDAKALAFSTSSDIVDSLKKVGSELGRLKFDSAGEFKRSVQIAGGLLAGVGAGVAATTVVVAKEVAEQTKQISKLSQSYGLSIEAVSQLRVASKLTGVDMDTLASGIGRLAKSSATAAEGGRMQQAAFAGLGVQYKNADGSLRPMSQLLPDVAEKFSKMQDGTGKTALAMQLLGKSGALLIPFLNEGKAGIAAFNDIADRFGLTIGGKDAQAALHLQENIELLDLASDGLKQQLAFGVVPALNSISSAFLSAAGGGESFARTLGGNVGTALVQTVKSIDVILTSIGEVEVALTHWGGDAQQVVDQMEQGLQDRVFNMSPGGMKVQETLSNPAVQKAMSEYRDRLKEIRTELDSGRISTENFAKAQASAAKVYADAFRKASDNPFGQGSAAVVPTFPSLEKGNSNFSELLSKASSIFDKDNSLQKQIDAIRQLQLEISQFEGSHPNAIFLSLNEAANKLSETLKRLLADQAAFSAIPGVIPGATQGALQNQISGALSLPQVAPNASGEVLQQRQLYDLTNDMNAQNRERLQIYEQTRTPMEKYAEDLQRLNTLYADKSSAEYKRAVADLDTKLREQYDPTIRLKKSLDDLALAYHLGAMNAQAMALAVAKVNADVAMANTVTHPQSGIAGVKQGIAAGAQSAGAQWSGLSNETAQATIQVAQKMQGAFSDFFSSITLGTKSLSQAFAQLGRDMLASIVNACAQMLAQWITTHIIMAAVAKIFGSSGDPSADQSAKTAAANMSMAESYAGLAAAEAFAYYMPEGLWTAIAMAGVADGISQGFVTQAGTAISGTSAAGGMFVDKDQAVNLHRGEMVLPAALSNGFQAIINSFRMPKMAGGYAMAGGGGSSLSLGDTHIHVNGARDPGTVASKVGNVVNSRVRRVMRGFK